MPNNLYVSTRKGLFIYERTKKDQWQLQRSHFLGDPVTLSHLDRRDNTLYAALNLGHFGVKLHRSDDNGKSWQEIAVPVYPTKPENVDDQNPWSLKLIWALATPSPSQPGVIWAGTAPGGLFRSADRGESWQLIDSLWQRGERLQWFGGGYDYPAIHSICIHPNDDKKIYLGISCGGVWVTENSGDSWQCQADGMFAEYMPPERRNDPNIQDPHQMVQCPSSPDDFWVQHHNGIFRSIDGTRSWQSITNSHSSFGFAVAVHPKSPDTAWFVPAIKDECRIPVDGNFIVARTRDGGQTFESFSEGLPKAPAYDLVYRHALTVDDTGTHLAMGSTTGGLWVSNSEGESWQCLSAHLPPINCVRFDV